MQVFNRRNALVGFLTLKALERKRRRQRVGRGLKIALFVVLAIVSVGVLAGIAAAFMRQRGDVEELLEEADAAAEEAADEVAAELDAAAAEPISTT
jgi:ABC-type spermidine/putrescine transport system permease subunit II